MGPEWAALTCTCKRTANSNFDRHYASCPMAAHNPASTVDLGPVADEIARLRARIEALEEALESISGFCLLHEAQNLGGAETVRRIHGVTDRILSTTEPDHG